MSDPTPPAVSEAMREAVAQWLRDRFPLNGWQSTAQAVALLKSGPIASEIARLTGERDAAVAKMKVFVEAYIAVAETAETEDARAHTAEAALSRLQVDRDAEVGKLRAALLLARQAVANHVESHRPWVEKIADRVNPWQATLNAVDAALTETPDA